MSTLSRGLATGFYRQVANVFAGMLTGSPIVQSVVLHRSAGSGEVSFGRSDIDLLVVLDEQEAEDGAKVASFYRKVERARLFNPALNHIDVYEPSGIQSHARLDTLWASVERRTQKLLRGQPVEVPAGPVHPDHALSKLLLWVDWFFAIAVQQRNPRNLWKISLECWSAYALAEGLIQEPCLWRSEMEAQARAAESNLDTKRLEEASYAVRFVFELADRLHRSRMPALRKLDQPLIFEAITAPLCLPRLFVVLPQADSPLPPEAFLKGAFPCTPEILNLFAHSNNAFIYWSLPRELRELGLEPPPPSAFLHSCAYYGHSRFQLYPGFVDTTPPLLAARTALLRHAVDWAAKGELPPEIPQDKIREMTADPPSTEDYFRTQYGPLRREGRRIQELLLGLSRSAASP
jgi:hypothetical protein